MTRINTNVYNLQDLNSMNMSGFSFFLFPLWDSKFVFWETDQCCWRVPAMSRKIKHLLLILWLAPNSKQSASTCLIPPPLYLLSCSQVNTLMKTSAHLVSNSLQTITLPCTHMNVVGQMLCDWWGHQGLCCVPREAPKALHTWYFTVQLQRASTLSCVLMPKPVTQVIPALFVNIECKHLQTVFLSYTLLSLSKSAHTHYKHIVT